MFLSKLISAGDKAMYGHQRRQRQYEQKLKKGKNGPIPQAVTKEEFVSARNQRSRLARLWCWWVGHTDTGCSVEKSFFSSSGNLYDGWKYHCARCDTVDIFPDKRSAYFRFRVWLEIRSKVPFDI